MPDSRPIAVFDSGVGGLTVLEEIHRLLPQEGTIYLGDLARCPYGVRPQEEVHRFTLAIADYLVALGVKLLVVACNTATAAAFASLATRYSVPVLGVIDPGAEAAIAASRNGRIGVVATDGTVRSGAYGRAIRARRADAQVVERGASWLVPLIEAGHPAPEIVTAGLQPVLAEMRVEGVDTLILGCTHFPLVRDVFAAEIGEHVTVLDSALTTAQAVRALLDRLGLRHPGCGDRRFLVTGPGEAFTARARTMFGATPEVMVVDLDVPVSMPAV